MQHPGAARARARAEAKRKKRAHNAPATPVARVSRVFENIFSYYDENMRLARIADAKARPCGRAAASL